MISNDQITHYDFDDLYYSSFFLTGFYQNAETFHYKFVVSRAAPRLLSDPIMSGRWRNILYSVCLFKARLSDEEFYFCIDTRDSCNADPDKGFGYHLPLLDKVKYYFKVNYNIEAINRDPNLRAFSSKIVPVLPFFPVKCFGLSTPVPRIFPCRVAAWTIMDAARRVKALKTIPTLEQLRQMRNAQKEFDIFYVSKFYDKEVHSVNMEFRYQILKEIQQHHNINSLVGFVSNKKLPGKYAELQIKPYPMKEHLSCIAKSRIGIYVRGLHDCLSLKFGELLALGMPIVGQPILNNRDNIMNNEYFNEQFAFDDPIGIAQEAIKMLDKRERLTTLGISNASVFDAKFTPKAVTSDILRHLNLN